MLVGKNIRRPRTHPPLFCGFSVLFPMAFSVFSQLTLYKLFCLCTGSSSTAVGTLTGIEGATLIGLTVYRQRETGVCFLRAGLAKESIQPMANVKKELFVLGGRGESKHSPVEHNELFCPPRFVAEKNIFVCVL